MKKLFILFLFFTYDLSSQDCSEFFLIRHAEKERTDLQNNNPNLGLENFSVDKSTKN